MHCAGCGSENREGAKFCNDCGAPLSLPCPSCQAENRPGARFCNECGTPLTRQSGVRSSASEVEEEVEECFRKAIRVAQKQQAKSLELRAVMSLSRLWQHQGKREDARQMLAEIYGWFTEGFDTKDLQEAKALLVELGEN